MELSKKDKRKLLVFIIALPVIGGLIGFLSGIVACFVLSLFGTLNPAQKSIAILGMTILMFFVGARTSWAYYIFLKGCKDK